MPHHRRSDNDPDREMPNIADAGDDHDQIPYPDPESLSRFGEPMATGDFDEEIDIEFADWAPLEPDLHERQIAGLLAWARRRQRTIAGSGDGETQGTVTVVDLGCGNGRALVPLVMQTGCRAIGIDDDPDAIAATQTVLIEEGLPVEAIAVLRHPSSEPEPVDELGDPVSPPGGGTTSGERDQPDRDDITTFPFFWPNEARVVLIEGDMHQVLRDLAGPRAEPEASGETSKPAAASGNTRSGLTVDAVLCVGYTWMLIETPIDGLRIARHIRRLLAGTPDDRSVAASVSAASAAAAEATAPRVEPAAFIIDDIPAEFWPRLIDGDWISGVSDDGQSQLAWDRSDNVFILREGADVDADDEQPRAGETRFRLWTAGELDLIAHVAGFRMPTIDPPHHLLLLTV